MLCLQPVLNGNTELKIRHQHSEKPSKKAFKHTESSNSKKTQAIAGCAFFLQFVSDVKLSEQLQYMPIVMFRYRLLIMDLFVT